MLDLRETAAQNGNGHADAPHRSGSDAAPSLVGCCTSTPLCKPHAHGTAVRRRLHANLHASGYIYDEVTQLRLLYPIPIWASLSCDQVLACCAAQPSRVSDMYVRLTGVNVR